MNDRGATLFPMPPGIMTRNTQKEKCICVEAKHMLSINDWVLPNRELTELNASTKPVYTAILALSFETTLRAVWSKLTRHHSNKKRKTVADNSSLYYRF